MIRCFSRLIEASAMDGLLQRLEDLRALLIEHELYLQAPSPAAPDAHAPPAAAASSAAPVKCARPPSPEVIVLDGLPGAALRRRRSFQLLEAPLNWPPGEADSVLLSNADLPQAKCVPERTYLNLEHRNERTHHLQCRVSN